MAWTNKTKHTTNWDTKSKRGNGTAFTDSGTNTVSANNVTA